MLGTETATVATARKVVDNSPKTNNRVINSVRRWFPLGFCPMTASVGFVATAPTRDLVTPVSCCRPLVRVKFGGRGDETLICGLHDHTSSAHRSAVAINGAITREWNRLKAELATSSA